MFGSCDSCVLKINLTVLIQKKVLVSTSRLKSVLAVAGDNIIWRLKINSSYLDDLTWNMSFQFGTTDNDYLASQIFRYQFLSPHCNNNKSDPTKMADLKYVCRPRDSHCYYTYRVSQKKSGISKSMYIALRAIKIK